MKTKVSVETIGDRKVTVIKKPFDADWVTQQLEMGIPLVLEIDGYLHAVSWANTSVDGSITVSKDDGCDAIYNIYDDSEFIVITLPALPRCPKPEDERLFYRYMAEGLEPIGCGTVETLFGDKLDDDIPALYLKHCVNNDGRITHAILDDSKRVEVAIEGGNDE